MAAQHGYIAVPAGAHTVSASFSAGCVAHLAASDEAAVEQEAAVNASAAAAVATFVSASAVATGTLLKPQQQQPLANKKGFPSAPPFPPATYPGSWSDLDFATGGAWLSSKKYGCEGYQLFGFDHGKDVTKLPSWVHSVTVLKGTTSFVGQNASNSSYLQDPNGAAHGAASLGFVTQGSDGSQGTVLDVNVTAGTKYKLSLYMVSSVSSGPATYSFTKQAIRVMDLATLDPIAPDPFIPNSPQGVYWTLSYDRGVRLRVMPIDSDAGWSALFFDKA